MKYIDLFCGIGSFHYSFRKFGFECIMACDIDKDVRNTYTHNYGIAPLGDIFNIEPTNLPYYDILCAGFPCQPFSQCGKHKGFEDERGTLFFQVMKFIRHSKPKIVILENVLGLLRHNNGGTFTTIKSHLEAENYNVCHAVLKCSDYGIPQMRRRLFIFSFRDDVIVNEGFTNFDEYRNYITLSSFLGKNFDKDIAYTIRCGGRNSPIGDRHNWDGYIVNGDEYRLTLTDCLKLQGFNDFELCGRALSQWRQIGNTIPTIFTEIICRNIIAYVGFQRKTFGNDFIRELINENKLEAENKIADELVAIFSLDRELLMDIYNKSISIHQGHKQRRGQFLEEVIGKELKHNNISFQRQVSINSAGDIIGFNLAKCFHNIDFVIGDVIIGERINNYLVISCKTSCRERWTQDNWTLKYQPKKYILITLSADYPSSSRFVECETRKIITLNPKRNDDRIYKLCFDDMISEINNI